MTSTGWGQFARIARVPDPSTIAKANQVVSQWSLQSSQQYDPDITFHDSQDRHHHSMQINVKFPANWDGMLNEFIAKSPRFRSLQDFVRTAIVHQMVYEGMREELVAQDPTVRPPIVLSEVIDNQMMSRTMQYDAWEKRIKSFCAMCDRMVAAEDIDGLTEELNKYDTVDLEETDMIPYYHDKFREAVDTYNSQLATLVRRFNRRQQ